MYISFGTELRLGTGLGSPLENSARCFFEPPLRVHVHKQAAGLRPAKRLKYYVGFRFVLTMCVRKIHIQIASFRNPGLLRG